jgi:putative RecB family exonuclease
MTAQQVTPQQVTAQQVTVVTLSPSRAADFKSCPLLYRFRAVDRLPEPPSPEALRGTLVHAVLERLFDVPAARRTPDQARQIVVGEWQRMVSDDPAVLEVVQPEPDDGAWLDAAGVLLDAYFALEDPRRLEPAERELLLEVTLTEDVVVKGVIDRLDVSADGELRVVDYKTGRAPSLLFEQQALFQLRVYALLLWRVRGRLPRMLQLMYLADRQIVRLEPHEDDLRGLERTLLALADAIARAHASRDFRPRTSRLCDWCPHRALCPAWGGTPPLLPERGAAVGSPTSLASSPL